jgi:predicted nucleotidyltransferase component of viral defense system
MNSSKKDYRKLYQLQDKFLAWWIALGLPFYLTGGTALGRFYLNHRFSEDLDFFVNANNQYPRYISEIKKKIGTEFSFDLQRSLFTEDFTRLFITDNGIDLKIDLVNDVDYYPGNPEIYRFGMIDTPLSILSNKLSAIIGRDEPKDVYDIVHISLNYSFNWQEIFHHSKQKNVINELDVERRMCSFPVSWLENINWLNAATDLVAFDKMLHQIADDFILGKDNSLGKNKMPIEQAKPNENPFAS